MPKLARRESEFFKELKKQDLCEDDVQERKDDSCEERGEQVGCDEVGCVVTQSCSSDSKQHEIDNETWPSVAAADNGDDDVTGFTSLQSSSTSVYRIITHFVSPVWGRGTLPFPPFPLVHLLCHLLVFFTFLFLSLALPIFFFCPSLPFLPE